MKLGFSAEPALRKALTRNLPTEARRRVGKVLERLQGVEALRATRALEALEQASAPEARELLTHFAHRASL